MSTMVKLTTLAKRANVSKGFIRDLIESGRLPASKISERVTLVSEDDWKEFILTNKVGG